MRKLVLLACILLLPVASAYAQFKFTNIDFPGGTLTTARGINNHGEIVGAYRIDPPRHALLIKGSQYIPLAPNTVLGTNYSEAFKNNDRGDVVGEYLDDAGFAHGFLLNKKGVLTTLDFPGASDTVAFGIDESGTVVGQWDLLDSGGNLIAAHGFTWDNGSFSQVDYPGSGDTFVGGINSRGDFVGEYDSGSTATVGHGFVFSKGQFTTFDVPVSGSTLTQLDDINANGQILGVYIDAGGAEHGFLQVGAMFTPIDYPGATITSAWGINSAGQIVGNHFGSDGISHGYLAVANKKGKDFVSFDFPLAGVTDTEATAITPSGTIVGRYFTPDGRGHGFQLTDGQFHSIDIPGATFSTDVTWINARGDIVGSYDSGGKTHAYVLGRGQLTTIDYPGAQLTLGFGISNAGEVVGTEFTDNFFTAHGYLFRNGAFILIDVPNAQATWPTMLESRRIVGTYFGPDSLFHGFLLRGGQFTTIDFPNSTFTWITGINPQGDIVGFYNDGAGQQHGFVLRRGSFISIDIPGAIATEANGIDPQDDVVGRYVTADGHTHGYFLARVK